MRHAATLSVLRIPTPNAHIADSLSWQNARGRILTRLQQSREMTVGKLLHIIWGSALDNYDVIMRFHSRSTRRVGPPNGKGLNALIAYHEPATFSP
jgi:hypothetical protein